MPKPKNKTQISDEQMWSEIKNFYKTKASLEDFFRNSDLGNFGGETPKILADMIGGIRTGRYKAWDVLLHYGREALRFGKRPDLTEEQAVKYISNPKFPDYVVKVCQRQEFPEWHASSYIYLALFDFLKDEKKAKKLNK